MKTYIGIDPGVNGGIAIIQNTDGNPEIVLAIRMPTMGKNVDFGEVASLFRYLDYETSIAYVEDVHAMPKQGVVSMFKFGFVTGGIHGVISALDIPLMVVRSSVWKNAVLRGLDKKDKQSSVVLCRRMFPDVSLLATKASNVPHTGIADAICIAYYALRYH